MSFQQLILDMGASTTGTSQSLETSSALSYIKQLYLDSFYINGANKSRLRIKITGTGVSVANTIVMSKRDVALTHEQKGGTEIYEVNPFSTNAGRQTFTMAYPILEKPINLKTTSLQVSVTDWEGLPITYTDLVLFFRVDDHQPHEHATGIHTLMRDPMLSHAMNQF